MADWRDIFNDDDAMLSEDEMLTYLDKNTPEAVKQVIEQKATANPFERDALKGLQQINNKEKIQAHVKNINKKLHEQIDQKRLREKRNKPLQQRWIILTIILLLTLCILGFLLIRLFTN